MTDSNWRFPSHVHATTSGGDLVLLDVRSDAYFCLPDVGQDFQGSAADRAVGTLPLEVRTELQAAGLLVRSDGAPSGERPALAPRDDLFDQPFPAPTRRERLDFARALVVMAWTYRGRPFEHILADASARSLALGRGEGMVGEALVRRSQVFRRLLPWSPVQGACLFQAVLLLEFLGQAGLTADWVFGVRTWPFGAHCWLQAGSTVLNDTVDRVAAFDPILVA